MTKSRGIVIPTSEGTQVFLKDLLLSIKTDYPVIVVGNNGYEGEGVDVSVPNNGFEITAVKIGAEKFDEFIVIPDTCVIKDNSMFDKMFHDYPSGVYMMERWLSFMNKYISKYVHETGVPEINNKKDAVFIGESQFHKIYQMMDIDHRPFEQLLPPHTDNVQVIHGSERCIIENDYIIKYKGNWGQKPL